MPKPILAALLAIVAVALTGCGRGARPFAPVVEKPPDASWPFVLPPLPPEANPAAQDDRQIRVFARFLSVTPRQLTRYGVDEKAPATVISCEQRMKLFEDVARHGGGKVLTAPNLLIRPGHPARIAMTSTYNYLSDYQRKKGDGDDQRKKGDAIVPVTNRVVDGMVLDLCAEIKGNDIVFTRIDPKIASALGMRQCTSRIDVGQEVALLIWEEPVALIAESTLVPTDRIELKPGTAIVVPLQHTLRIVTANARSLTEYPVEVKNAESLRFLSRLGERGYPLPSQIIVVLDALIVREPTPEPKSP